VVKASLASSLEEARRALTQTFEEEAK